MVDMDDQQEEKKRKSSDKKDRKKRQAEAKEEEVVDLVNFKGLYFGNDDAKKTDDETGAHFIRGDLCKRLERAKAERAKREQDWDDKLKRFKR